MCAPTTISHALKEAANSVPTSAQLSRYADVLIRIGLNVQPNQAISISGSLETAEFTRILASRLYDAGAGVVDIDWYDPPSRRMRLEKAPAAALTRVPKWQIQKSEQEIEENTGFIYIDAEDPDLLSGVDPSRVATYQKAQGTAFKEIDDLFMSDRVTWVVCSVPSAAWACKMFPDAPSPADAMESLWSAIFTVMRMDEPDPVAAWQRHFDDLDRRAAFLNQHRFRRLHYRGPGTDLSVELPDKHRWVSARSVNHRGDWFCANLPTEELYTLPKRDGVNGTVRSTMPLSYSGVILEDTELRFEHGRIVEYSAKSGYETLRELIDTDDGSHYLGEVALVPIGSPIARLNRLFYNTLFDENASCHLAIGKAYPTCLEGGSDMTEDELVRHGVNDSINHVDFMVGSEVLNIIGETYGGAKVPVLSQGRWAI